jgi:hypothetical protein
MTTTSPTSELAQVGIITITPLAPGWRTQSLELEPNVIAISFPLEISKSIKMLAAEWIAAPRILLAALPHATQPEHPEIAAS